MIFEDNYNKFVNYALKISKDDELCYDLVQEAYLKIGHKEDVNLGYVYKTIHSIFIDHKRKEKINVSLDYVDKYEQQSDFELFEEYNEVLNNMPFAIKECLLENQNYSLRKLEKRYNINYGKILRMVNKAKSIIRENQKLKEYYGK